MSFLPGTGAATAETAKMKRDDPSEGRRSPRKRRSDSWTQTVHRATSSGGMVHELLQREFSLLDEDNDGVITAGDLVNALDRAGLRDDDPRLRPLFAYLRKQAKGRKSMAAMLAVKLDVESFAAAVSDTATLVLGALSNELVIPDFEAFTREVADIFEEARANRGGEVADYIPELANADPDLWAISICTIDGQRWSMGDVDSPFCIQSCSKPLSYLIASSEHGIDHVHDYVGCEPSGVKFNEMVLKEVDRESTERHAKSVPHNPMVNAGAIMIASLLLESEHSMSQRFKSITEVISKLCGGPAPGFQNATYLSEKETAFRNWALGYMMKEDGSFPATTNLRETLELYFQVCSLEMNTEMMSTAAASLARFGVCPTTSERVFNSDNVRACLSLMSSCGMYDYSGEWDFKIGLPAKSGVAGAVMVVVPNLMGIVCYSPPLDKNGNSVRGVDFFQRLCKRFALHVYDNDSCDVSGRNVIRRNPRVQKNKVAQQAITELLFAASTGDLHGIRRMVVSGMNCLLVSDYDARTALHIAASNGHNEVIKYLLNLIAKQKTSPGNASEISKMVSPRDRWNRTPLDDAISSRNIEIVALLRAQGAVEGHSNVIDIQLKSKQEEQEQEDGPAPTKMMHQIKIDDPVVTPVIEKASPYSER